MHDFSMAKDMARLVLDRAKKDRAKKITSIKIQMGELSSFTASELEFWLKTSLEGTIARGAKINIEVIKPLVSCGDCGYSGKPEIKKASSRHPIAPELFSCPACKSCKIQVKKGAECLVKSIEVLK